MHRVSLECFPHNTVDNAGRMNSTMKMVAHCCRGLRKWSARGWNTDEALLFCVFPLLRIFKPASSNNSSDKPLKIRVVGEIIPSPDIHTSFEWLVGRVIAAC